LNIQRKYGNSILTRWRLITAVRVEGILRSNLFWIKQSYARESVYGKGGTPKDPYSALMLNRNELEAMEALKIFDSDHIWKLKKESGLIAGKRFRGILQEINYS